MKKNNDDEEQGNLFDDICRNRHGGQPESEEANRHAGRNKNRDRFRILMFLDKFGAHTTEQIERALQLRRSSASARMSELKRDRLITKVGIGVTTTGSPAGIYDIIRKKT